MPAFEFQFECNPFVLQERKLKQWILRIIAEHHQKAGDLSFIFCTDEQLLEINQKFLNHDYYTDIISFPLDEKKVGGELYISVDRVRENAISYKVDFEWELFRVMIHGILHLCGQDDHSPEERAEMIRKENEALSLWERK